MSKPKRWCLAIENHLTPAECGQNRASRYDCPVDCPFNPWSPQNYERALEIERGLDAKMFAALKSEMIGDAESQSAIGRLDESDEITRQQFFVELFYLKQDAAGQTFAQRLRKKGGLSNDETVLLERLAQMRPALFEIHRVLNDAQCEAVDLIDEKRTPFLIQDWNLTARAVRFMQGFGWTFAMPHYRRLHGAVCFLPEVSELDADAVLREIVAHLGGPVAPAEALREWLARHTSEVNEASRATASEQQRRTWQQIDARICQSTYAIRGDRGSLLRRLARCDDFAPGALAENEEAEGWREAFDCFDEAAPWEPGQAGLALDETRPIALGRPVLGRVIVGDRRLRVETSASARLQALKTRLEKRVGNLLEFVSERVEDLARKFVARIPAADLSRVPAALLQNPPQLSLSSSRIEHEMPPGLSLEEAQAALMELHQRQWIDTSVPALGGKTPREAAADPSLRPILIRMMKQIIRRHDQGVLKTGGPQRIDWLTTELGLDEVAFPPPPARALVPEEDTDLSDLAPEAGELDEFLYDPPPPLPAGPLAEEELVRRLEAIDREWSDPDDAIDELATVAPDLLDAIDALAQELKTESEVVLITTVARAWFIFFPPGTAPARFDAAAFLADAADETDRFIAALERDPGSLLSFLESGPQPALALMLSGPLFALSKPGKRPKTGELRVPMEELPLLIGALRAFIGQADRAAR